MHAHLSAPYEHKQDGPKDFGGKADFAKIRATSPSGTGFKEHFESNPMVLRTRRSWNSFDL